jgi:hypothetical protein
MGCCAKTGSGPWNGKWTTGNDKGKSFSTTKNPMYWRGWLTSAETRNKEDGGNESLPFRSFRGWTAGSARGPCEDLPGWDA